MTKLVVALDMKPGLEARALVSKLVDGAGVSWFKIGVPMLLDADEGARTADFIRWRGQAQMMLDLKLYDTRDTVLRALDGAVALGAAMLTVHADCVIHTLGDDRLKILAVRKLTDRTGQRPAHDGMADGIICSVRHARFVRQYTDKLLVCPGIRRDGAARDNHTDAATPLEAREAGADFIVVGRPIIFASDPVAAALAVLHELTEIRYRYSGADGTKAVQLRCDNDPADHAG